MIREVRVEDASSIQIISDKSLGYPVSIELIENQIRHLKDDKSHIIRVYVDDDTNDVLAYVEAEIYQALYSEKGLNILGLAVLEEAQGKGIGKKLMAELERIAKESSFAYIRLNSASHRKQAHAFYESIGYKSDKIQKRFIKIMNT
ncbi:hypothetical protein HMPREF9318_00598 [Streptococcus urinalis FB127-CNA-2]|uniref:FR47-like protein n=1 Tax=Streptococcus urinalis 2285-97 TaxID=764291 RepID=G5KGW0_9STRE|nr:GNAT family N-acetyltransferase [Streptococcus urinalis]EHJ56970.1 FR47-like protein [Streptococcus urinalis 2285-97]EKS22400.1 hypothetical protein HMPREF9318_00598 [Streptococcus urinalis FB127-CNA-2]VEF32213.1 GNAT family acetyltransferase [Streptococcus urinalis]